MTSAGLIIGSNLDNRLDYMNQAVKSLESRVGKLVAKSSVYVSPPWGYSSSNEYYNQVLLFETSLRAERLLEYCLRIEKVLGRVRSGSGGYSDRTIDIDILYIGDTIIENSRLTVPHPRMHLRKFCLLPLYEVNPDWIHPLLQKDMIHLIDNCGDDSEISRLS